MRRHGSLARSALRARFATFHGPLLLVAAGVASGCLVSFDGYQALSRGGESGVAGDEATSGKATGGKQGQGGKAQGGNAGTGASEPLGGEGGESNEPGGDANGGDANGGGANGGSGGARGGGGGTDGGAGKDGSVGGSGSGGSGGSEPTSCPVNLEGPPMIEVPKATGGFFCMDRTEVPNEDYATFLATNPSLAGQEAACSWNDSFQPDTSVACATALGAYDPVARPRVPVSCIDWCDAKRYCAWAGKRLCGAIAGGPNPPESYIDANASQWYRACSKAGAQKFPYGNAYQPSSCVGLDNSGTHPSPVASAPACQGGYDGLFDLSGNVAEWEDSCSANAGANDACLTRGGSIQSVESVAPSLLCNDSTLNDATPSPTTSKRNTKDELIGLRCCLDL